MAEKHCPLESWPSMECKQKHGSVNPNRKTPSSQSCWAVSSFNVILTEMMCFVSISSVWHIIKLAKKSFPLSQHCSRLWVPVQAQMLCCHPYCHAVLEPCGKPCGANIHQYLLMIVQCPQRGAEEHSKWLCCVLRVRQLYMWLEGITWCVQVESN